MTLLKGIVACLALANIGYFLWTRGVGDREPPPSVAATPESGLKLASESSGSARASAAGAAPETSAGERAGETSIAGTSGGADAQSGAPASSEPADRLLTDVKRCISVGPFRDVAETARAASTLRAGGYDPRQRVAEGEVWAGVWVYLPITAAHSSEQMQAKLKVGGVEDALEMPAPTEGSVLSLGLFSDAKRAQARVAQAQALGFNPSIVDRKRTGDVYWIDIDLKPTDSVLRASDLQSDAGRIVRLEVKACPPAAGGTAP
ncbi:MAG TPA: hypothetical protein VHY75_15560 [Steroidobacteraceae bacterium]|nr:hypothetical protein [Steroidobacteraceae bacterium]